MSNKPWKYHSFTEMLRVPILFYKTIGEELYEHRADNRIISLLLKILFYAGFINFNVLVAGEIIYFLQALQNFDTVLEATAVAPCIGFSLVSDFKQAALAVHKKLLRQHLDELEAIFPSSLEKQLEYKLPRYAASMRLVIIVFSLICLAYTSTFSFYPICKSFVQYYLMGMPVFERNFGFFIWYPYNSTQNRLIYGITYMSQVHGAYLAGVAFLSADLLLVASVTFLCMHFNYISDRLESLRGDNTKQTEEQHMEDLLKLVKHHAKCLELSEHVNTIFSFSLLLNFLTASLTICFIGFQVTASSLEDIIKYCIFLVASMLQVFIVCYYGDELISASSRVGIAAYNQEWFDCSPQYKKTLIYIMMRSQKEASIRAPTFPPISFNTYMKVISMSYQFFALLRTTYYED